MKAEFDQDLGMACRAFTAYMKAACFTFSSQQVNSTAYHVFIILATGIKSNAIILVESNSKSLCKMI